MPHNSFSSEYKAIKDILTSVIFTGSYKTTMDNLKPILEATGPATSYNSKLENLRNLTLRLKETDRILEAAGIASGATGAPTTDQFKKVAAIKFLRHLHLAALRGSQVVWIHSAPKLYRKFIYDELDGAKDRVNTLKAKLDKKTEFFDATTQTRIAEATQLGLSWVEKTKLVLSNAKTDVASRAKVKRWFAESTTTDIELNQVIAKLDSGFKKIANTLNFNSIIITDYPADRGKLGKKYEEAYMLEIASVVEKPRTIYIEQAMFANYDISVLHDMKKNWARILVHECTHIDAATEDEQYAYLGVKPGVGITAAQAAQNADSWAFFAADCGGALVAGDITRALDGTSGSLTELAKNWR